MGVVAVSLSDGALEIGSVLVAFMALALFLKMDIRGGFRDVWIMLPWAMAFFAIHAGFVLWAGAAQTPLATLGKESIVLQRLIGLSLVLGTVRHGIEGQTLIDSLKTALDQTGLHSRWGEDAVQTLRLTLSFIPQAQDEFKQLQRFHAALGFSRPRGLRQRIRYYGSHITPVLSRSMDRARQVGLVMEQRGYGRVVPRGQLTPVPFRSTDAIWVGLGMMLLGVSLWAS